MNPLFSAHLVADFLFQTDAIVRLKKKNLAGILIHGIIHALVLGFFLFPAGLKGYLIVLFIAGTHAIIDHVKIIYQKKKLKFELVLLLDQFAHLTVLIFVALLFPMSFPFWKTETGESILEILFFISFIIGTWNLINAKEYNLTTTQSKIKICVLMIVIFLLYIMPAKLFAI